MKNTKLHISFFNIPTSNAIPRTNQYKMSFLHPINCTIDIPEKFTFPYEYTPNKLCIKAAKDIIAHLKETCPYPITSGKGEGKMFGVLIACKEEEKQNPTNIYFLAAYSGTITWKEDTDYFVPAIFNLPNNIIPNTAEESRKLQLWIFHQYHLLNSLGETKDIIEIFEDYYSKYKNSSNSTSFLPPSGTGECCAPKLLQYAYQNHLHPLCMGEFWQGEPLIGEQRFHNNWYPSCQNKCKPLLTWMLKGIDVEENPLIVTMTKAAQKMDVIYEDEWLIAINKPSGMLSVPGNVNAPSVESIIRQKNPSINGPIIVHRLDMDTSGIMLLAKTKEVHKALQTQFFKHEIRKKYIALLDGTNLTKTKLHEINNKHIISLPLSPSPNSQPKQMVNHEHGKEAVTEYTITDCSNPAKIRVEFYPQTGRTHQLRVHSSTTEGLGCPIVGDRLYSNTNTTIEIDDICEKADRLYLQAVQIEFTHPIKKTKMTLQVKNEF